MKNNDRIVLTLTFHPQEFFVRCHRILLRIFRMSLTKSFKDYLVTGKFNVNHLRMIIKLRLVVGLDAKFFLLLKKLTLFQTKIKVKCLMLEKGLRTLLAIFMFN